MPPPHTIPDSDADSDPLEPSTSPEPPGPSPSMATTSLPAPASRKRSASPGPPSVHQEAIPITEDAPINKPVVTTEAAKPDEESVQEPLSEEAREEERRAKQIEAIKTRNKELGDEVEAMEAKLQDARGKLKNPDAAATVKAHIKRLHAYNEIRDVGQGLIGMIAEQRGVRIGECYDSGEFGVGAKD